jgi:spermidine/putrescine transport system permease protein
LLGIGLIDAPLRLMYTETAVMIGLVYILLPFMILPLYSAIEKLDHTYIEAAQDLGATRVQTLLKVVLPLTMPGIIAGCLLVLLPALGMFYISDLLGGAKNLLIGNVIKSQVLNARDWPLGAATSVSLTLVMAVMLYAHYRTVKLLNKKSELDN